MSAKLLGAGVAAIGALAVGGAALVKAGPGAFATAGLAVGGAEPEMGAFAVLRVALLAVTETEGFPVDPGTGTVGFPGGAFAGTVLAAGGTTPRGGALATGAEPGVIGLLPTAPAGLATGFETGAPAGFTPGSALAGLGIGPFAVDGRTGFDGAALLAIVVGGFAEVFVVPVGGFEPGVPCLTGAESGLELDTGAVAGAFGATLGGGTTVGEPVVGGVAFGGGVAAAGAGTFTSPGTAALTSAIAQF